MVKGQFHELAHVKTGVSMKCLFFLGTGTVVVYQQATKFCASRMIDAQISCRIKY